MLAAAPAGAVTVAQATNVREVSDFIAHVNPYLSREMGKDYAQKALDAAHAQQIDPCLLLAIVSVESHWKANAISDHGAIGLGQLKASTAAALKVNPFSPQQNLLATSRYLRYLFTRFTHGDRKAAAAPVAIAAYNAGPTAVAMNHERIPSRMTAAYVRSVMRLWSSARQALNLSPIAVPAVRFQTAPAPELPPNFARGVAGAVRTAAVDTRPAVASSGPVRPALRPRRLARRGYVRTAFRRPARWLGRMHYPSYDQMYWGLPDHSDIALNASSFGAIFAVPAALSEK